MNQPITMLDGRVSLYPGDCRETLKNIPDNSIDSVVTDPPYALISIVKRFGKPGSGSTGEAAYREGFNAILCEREAEYITDIQERMRLANSGPVERTQRKIKQAGNAGPLFGDAC